MTLKEYIKKLQALEAEHGDCEVVYAVDSEGNDYAPVEMEPEHHESVQGNGDEYNDVIVIN